jgi:hypothetical protein
VRAPVFLGSRQNEREVAMRTTTEVLHDHLMRRLSGDVGGDIEANYDANVVVLTGSGIYHGHEGVMNCADELARLVGGGSFRYDETLVCEGYAYLEWSAVGDSADVADGADSFVVRDGRIVMQTVHYTPR